MNALSFQIVMKYTWIDFCYQWSLQITGLVLDIKQVGRSLATNEFKNRGMAQDGLLLCDGWEVRSKRQLIWTILCFCDGFNYDRSARIPSVWLGTSRCVPFILVPSRCWTLETQAIKQASQATTKLKMLVFVLYVGM